MDPLYGDRFHAPRAIAALSTRSSLFPDCEIARKSWPLRRSWR